MKQTLRSEIEQIIVKYKGYKDEPFDAFARQYIGEIIQDMENALEKTPITQSEYVEKGFKIIKQQNNIK